MIIPYKLQQKNSMPETSFRERLAANKVIQHSGSVLKYMLEHMLMLDNSLQDFYISILVYKDFGLVSIPTAYDCKRKNSSKKKLVKWQLL